MDTNEVSLFTIAQPFKKLGKDELTIDEFTFALSLDLEWFSPQDAKLVLQNATKSGLVTTQGGLLKPAFDLKKVKKPVGFKPDINIFTREKSIFDEISIRLEGKISKKELKDRVNKKIEELGDIIDEGVIFLLVAKELGLKIDDLVDEAYKSIFSGD